MERNFLLERLRTELARLEWEGEFPDDLAARVRQILVDQGGENSLLQQLLEELQAFDPFAGQGGCLGGGVGAGEIARTLGLFNG